LLPLLLSMRSRFAINLAPSRGPTRTTTRRMEDATAATLFARVAFEFESLHCRPVGVSLAGVARADVDGRGGGGDRPRRRRFATPDHTRARAAGEGNDFWGRLEKSRRRRKKKIELRPPGSPQTCARPRPSSGLTAFHRGPAGARHARLESPKIAHLIRTHTLGPPFSSSA